MSRRGIVIVVLAAFMSLSVLTGVRAASIDPFSAHELKKLNSGQLVVRPSVEKRGELHLSGGSSWQLIDRPAEAVWRALLDTRNYPKFLPAVTAARAVVNQSGHRVVRLTHKAGPLDASYDLSMRIYPERQEITFVIENKPSFGPRAGWGFVSVRPYQEDRTLLSYGAMVDPGHGLLVSVLRGTIQDWVLRVPEQAKRFVESTAGRSLYAEK